MFVLPSKDSKKFVQQNAGDTQGNLWSTFGIDITQNPGKVRTKRSLMAFEVNTFAGLTTVATPTAYALYDVTGDGVLDFITYAGQPYYSPDAVTAPVSVIASQPITTGNTGNGDLKVFNNKVYCTTNTELFWTTNFTWTNLTSGLSNYPHPMEVYQNRLYIADYNKVYSLDTSNSLATSGSNTLDLSSYGGYVSWIRSSSNSVWVGFTSLVGGKGLIFEWDGKANVPTNRYKIDAQGSTGCAIKDNIPYVMDINGRLIAYNGSGFQEVARLPILQRDAFSYAYIRPIGHKLTHFNGLVFSNDRLLINVCSRITQSPLTGVLNELIENFPSGVWEYTKETGLVHLMAPSRSLYTDPTNLKDYGIFETINAGAIYDSTTTTNANPVYTSTIVFGAAFTNSSEVSSTRFGSFVDDARGYKSSSYIITSLLESDNVTDVFNKLIVKYLKLQNVGDVIKLKYRTYKKPFIPVLATFASTTTLTVNSGSYSQISDVSVGDEMQVTLGLGAGQCVNVTSIVNNAGIYTITVDEPILGAVATKTCDVMFQNWKKLPTITRDDFQYKNTQLPFSNKDINAQFKVIMEWEGGNELNNVMVVNDTDQFAK